MSGHSKWATIKHKKGALDAKRGKLFAKLTKDLTVAARGGGGDTTGNPRLRKAISDAKGQSMPNDTINRAVKRGTGELEGAAYEEVRYEGTGPSGTLYLVEGMTDNRNRTVAEIRKIIERHNGVLGGAGMAVKSSGLGYLQKTKKPLTGRDAEVCLNLAEAIDDHDDVQNVYSDFDISDEEMRKIAGE